MVFWYIVSNIKKLQCHFTFIKKCIQEELKKAKFETTAKVKELTEVKKYNLFYYNFNCFVLHIVNKHH